MNFPLYPLGYPISCPKVRSIEVIRGKIYRLLTLLALEYLMIKNVLYYPTIEFIDETWLKTSLCLWDKIYRIVPQGYEPNDSNGVKIAIEKGLIKNIQVTKQDLAQTAEWFENYLNNAPIVPAGVDDWGNVNLHSDKVDARILPILEGLAEKIDPDGFLSVNREVANIYMLFLADIVAKRRNISKLTDNADMFSIMHYFANDANFDEWVYVDNAEEMTSSLAIATLMPTGLETTSIEKVIEFRKKTNEPRQIFRNSIDNLVKEICLIEEDTFKVEKIKDFQESIKTHNTNIIEAGSEIIKDFKHTLLSVGLPTSMSALGLLTGSGSPYDLTQIGSSCFIGAVAALADTSKTKRKKWKKFDSFYYHQLNKVFSSGNGVRFTTPHYGRIYEEFIND